MDSYQKISKQGGIYLFTNKINGKLYVGKTQNFDKRISKYRSEIKMNNSKAPMMLALTKYGWENFDFRIIEITENMPNNEVLFRESLWIKHFRCLISQGGYNICAFSADQTGVKQTKEHIANAQANKKKFKHSEETKKRLSEIGFTIDRRGKNHHFFGIKFSKEYKKKLSEGNFNFYLKNTKPVKQIDRNTGEVIKIWRSAIDAALGLNKSRIKNRMIVRAIKRGNVSYGFRWEYSE